MVAYWYLTVVVVGIVGWPLAYSLLPGLPDRGYGLSKALGLLLTGYVFWLLGSLGLLINTVGSIILSMLIVAGLGISIFFARQKSTSVREWLRENLSYVVVAELLFAVAFAAWVIVRAYNPDIAGTEKPMELTFLNGVRTSATFPPRDPWLADYAISYYYFGYVIVAILADLSGAISSVAFNLAIATLFGLTLLGSYSLVYNLVASRTDAPSHRPQNATKKPVLSALLGSIFVGVMGNLAGFFELLHATVPSIPADFWTWLDLEDLTVPVTQPLWPPSEWRFWWWWRASRVIRDRDIAGTAIGLQPIDEFPFFSFLLGDMHPHVLALPFVLLALTLALNVLLQKNCLSRPQILLYVICFGGLAFLNTWDLPIYLFILVGALLLRRLGESADFSIGTVLPPILIGALVLTGGIIAYLPWYISFSSQAGGILPNVLFPTRLHQFLIMFGPFIIILVLFLVAEGVRQRRHLNWQAGIAFGGGLLIALILIVAAMGAVVLTGDDPEFLGARRFIATSIDPALANQTDEALAEQSGQLVSAVVAHRLSHPLTALLLTAMVVGSAAMLVPSARSPEEDDETLHPYPERPPASLFVFLLILTAAMLTLGPEFLYLRDVFGQRLNTVFKFYYAAWILFGVSAAYAMHILVNMSRPATRTVIVTIVVALTGMGLVYPAFAVPAKAAGLKPVEGVLPTLDGIAYINRTNADDYQAIQWIQNNIDPDSVILEAVGGQYSYYGRVSMSTGRPTLLGWPGHERQWRGPLYPELAGSREDDIRQIYDSPNIPLAEDLLRRYDVDYVYIGSLERSADFASPAGIAKFERFLEAVYRQGNVVIYDTHQIWLDEVP